MKRNLVVAAVISALAVSSAACGGSGSSEGSSDTYNVVVLVGTTGPNEAAGKLVVTAMQESAKYINENGGVIDGRDIKITVVDTQGDPTKAVTVLTDELNSGDPDALFVSNASPETLAMLPALSRKKIVSVATSQAAQANDPASFPYHFGFTPGADAQLSALPDELESTGVKKLAVLLPQDALGDGQLAGLEKAVPDTVEIEVTRYNPKDLDLSIVWEKANASSPDAIYAECFGDPCGRLFDGRAAADVVDVPAIFGSGAGSTAGGPTEYAAPEALENVKILMWTWALERPDSELSDVDRAFLDAMQTDDLSTNLIVAAFAWDALQGLALGVNEAGTDDPVKVAQGMIDVTVPDDAMITSKGLDFTEENHFPPAPNAVISYVAPGPLKNGLFVPVS